MLLVNKGIAESRIETKWYGDTDPIATNETEAGRAQNRRTEYILYQK
jgi:outer membrane protein OmpA-like peptidoglycan-associated protein